uniref:hypothetical protein n=1 Tax=Enterobacter hormaechei TaxID=158836 RepID=UPI00203CF8EA
IDYNDGLYPTPVTSEWSTHVGVPGACCVSCVGVTESPEGKKRLLTHFALQLSEEATLPLRHGVAATLRDLIERRCFPMLQA